MEPLFAHWLDKSMHFIEHTFSPTRLLLAWQAPDGENCDRSPCVIGELRDQDGVVSFRYLTDTEDFRRAVNLGFVCYPAFRKLHGEYTDGVIDSFLRRLPPRSRGDFPQFLEQWRLPATVGLSHFALLAYTGAKLPSDGFSVVWPLDEVAAPGEVLLEVAGFRYQDMGVNDVVIGAPVHFVLEPENAHDNKAVRMEMAGRRIGYVKRLQRNAVSSWLTRYDVRATLERFNGTPDRPIIYVFCRLTERRPISRPSIAVG